MGSFGGHALPGSFFIIVGLYWTVQFYRKLFESLRKGGTPFYATVTFPCDCCCDDDAVDDCSSSTGIRRRAAARRLQRRCCLRIDWEGVVKVFFSTVGFFVEVIFSLKDTGRFVTFGSGQHATMFFFFGLSGLADILVKLRTPLLPRGSEYLFGILAFVVEALLFMFHLHGRSTMDVLVHTLLIYVLYATIVVCLLEAKFRRVPLLVFVRAFLLIVQGTWFWQVGFILYKPLPGSQPWSQEDHGHIMVITLMFAWHIAAVLTVMISIGVLVHMTCYRRVTSSSYQDDAERRMQMRPIKLVPSENSSHLADEDDLDSDLECRRERSQ